MRVTAPELLDLQRSDSGLEVHGRVPEALVFFAGHFPGHPVLAGFVQLDWVLALAREHLDERAAPCAIEALKFRAPLLPGQTFELRLDRAPGRIRFEFRDGARVVSSGRFRFDERVVQHLPVRSATAHSESSGFPLQLPQTGRMRLLERVIAHEGGVTVCEARIDENTPLWDAGRVSAALSVELLAQAVAANGSLAARGRGTSPRGLLAGARRIVLHTPSFATGERLWVRVEHVRGETGMVAFQCALGSGPSPNTAAAARDQALASGTLAVFVGGRSAGSANPSNAFSAVAKAETGETHP